MRTGAQKRAWRLGTRVAVVAICTTSVGVIISQARAGAGSCFKDHPGPACDHYVDDSPECPDVTYGGGQCGNPSSSASGQTSTSPTNPDCVVTIRKMGPNGCYTVGTFTVTVSCNVASGSVCPVPP
jgi:hypothetical protein